MGDLGLIEDGAVAGGALGSIEPGKQADLLIMSVADYRSIGYRYGTNLVSTVIKRGHIVVENGRLT